jgi:hypothetical protein
MNTIPLADWVESPKLPYFSTLKPSPSDTYVYNHHTNSNYLHLSFKPLTPLVITSPHHSPDTFSTQLDFHKRINAGKIIDYHAILPPLPTTTAHHTLGLTYHSGHSSDLTRPGSLLGTSPSTTPVPIATIHGSLLGTSSSSFSSTSSALNYVLSISGDKLKRIEGEGYHDFSKSLGIDYLLAAAATPECRLEPAGMRVSGDAAISATFLNKSKNANVLVRPITWKHKIEVSDHHHNKDRNVHHSSSLSVPVAKEQGVARVRLERKDWLPLSPTKDADDDDDEEEEEDKRGDSDRLQYTTGGTTDIASSTTNPFVITLEIAPKMLAKTTKISDGDEDEDVEEADGSTGGSSTNMSSHSATIKSTQSQDYKISRIPSAKCEMYQNGKYAVKWRQVWAPQLVTTLEMSSVLDKARLHTKLRPISWLQVSSVMSSSMSTQTLQRAGVKVGCRLKGKENFGSGGRRRVHMLEVESTMVVDRCFAYKVKYKTRGGRLINNGGVSVFGKRDEGREKGLKFELEAVW